MSERYPDEHFDDDGENFSNEGPDDHFHEDGEDFSNEAPDNDQANHPLVPENDEFNRALQEAMNGVHLGDTDDDLARILEESRNDLPTEEEQEEELARILEASKADMPSEENQLAQALAESARDLPPDSDLETALELSQQSASENFQAQLHDAVQASMHDYFNHFSENRGGGSNNADADVGSTRPSPPPLPKDTPAHDSTRRKQFTGFANLPRGSLPAYPPPGINPTQSAESLSIAQVRAEQNRAYQASLEADRRKRAEAAAKKAAEEAEAEEDERGESNTWAFDGAQADKGEEIEVEEVDEDEPEEPQTADPADLKARRAAFLNRFNNAPAADPENL